MWVPALALFSRLLLAFLMTQAGADACRYKAAATVSSVDFLADGRFWPERLSWIEWVGDDKRW